MKKLKLPIIRGEIPRKKAMSMDEYVKFVMFNLKHLHNAEEYERQKKKKMVNVRFVLKD